MLSIFPRFLGTVLLLVAASFLWKPSTIALDSKSVWFVWVIGVACFGLGTFSKRGAPQFGFVVATIILGGGAQLWLTQPLWFPAIQLRPKSTIDAVMFAIIGLQAGVAIWALWGSGIRRLAGWKQSTPPLPIIVFLLLSFIFSVSAQGYLPRGFLVSYGMHLIAASALVGVNLASLAALQMLPPPEKALRGFNPMLPAGVVLVAGAALAWFGFERIPHVEDEAVYLFQAKTFAAGMLAAPAPNAALLPGLDYYLLEMRDGQWLATTPPGWAALLAIGVSFGAPWLVNPVLAALSVLLAHNISRRLAGRVQADIVALLMATSPWFLAASASLMPHSTTIFLTLLTWWFLLLETNQMRRNIFYALLAGLAMGWVFATRQLEGVLIGTATGLWLTWRWKRDHGVLRVASYSIGAILTGSAYLLHNLAMTGNVLLSPLARYVDETWQTGANSYGFGPSIGPPGGWGDLDMKAGHWPSEGIINTLHNLSALQLELFGWGIGSLALVFALFLWGRPTSRDKMMLGICLIIALAMFFYWFSGGYYLGPRYWYSMLFPIVFLSASGYFAVSGNLKKIGVHGDAPAYTLLSICLFGLLVFTPWRGVEKYHNYNDFTASIGTRLAQGELGTALVFYDTPNNSASAFYLNDPYLPGDRPIFLMDLGPETNARAIAAFPERQVLYVSD